MLLAILTHAAVFMAGIVGTVILARAVARHELQRQAEAAQARRIAIRADDAQRLWGDIERGLRALRELDALRNARLQAVPPPDGFDPDFRDALEAILRDIDPTDGGEP